MQKLTTCIICNLEHISRIKSIELDMFLESGSKREFLTFITDFD